MFKKYLVVEVYEDVTKASGVCRIETPVTFRKGKKIMRTWKKRIAAGECIRSVVLARKKDGFVREKIMKG